MSNYEEETARSLAECERRIQYVFRDKGLLRCALTQRLRSRESPGINERLEFPGDAVLRSSGIRDALPPVSQLPRGGAYPAEIRRGQPTDVRGGNA